MKEVDIYAADGGSDNFSVDSFVDDSASEPVDGTAEDAAAAEADGAEAFKQSGGKKHQEPIVVIKKQEEMSGSEYEPESEDDVSSESSNGSDSTVDCLSRDPLFLVLSQYLSNSEGNIVDVLCKINKSLKRLVKALEKA